MTKKQKQAVFALWDALSDILEEEGALEDKKLRARAMRAIRKAFRDLPKS